MGIHNKNNKDNELTRVSLGISGVLLGATAIAGGVLISQPTLADTTKTTDVSVSVSSVCNLTSDVSEAHTAEITPGLDFESNIGTTNMTATCNDGNGYAIYAVGFTGDAIGQTNSTKLVGAGGTIDTRDYDASYDSTSYWSMKLTAGTGTDAATIENSYDTYKAIPASYTKVASKASATSATPTTAFSTTYGAYAVTSQTAGDYSGKVKYILVHPGSNQPGTYTIAFNANGGSGEMTSQTGLLNYEDQTINTMSGITAPSGYQFAGWCNNQESGTSATNPQTTCSGTTYNDAGTVPANTVNANGTLTLYAFWSVIPRTYMQDLTATQCQEQASDQAITVYDRRDGSDYTVRYINNACWMTQNLRITGTISATDSNFTGSDFNTMAGGDLRGSAYTYTDAQSHLADSTDVEASASATGGPYTTDQLGAWYNYCAASAGQVCSQTQMDATQDICPAGWKLPTYNTTPGNFSGITGSATTADTNANKFTPIYGGYYSNGSLVDATTYGYWWSSTARNASGQYGLRYDNGSLRTYSNLTRLGFYVRCMRSS